MISPQLEKLLAQAQRIQLIVWGALTGSIVLYALVPWVLPADPNPDLAGTLGPVFMGLGAALAAASLVFRQRASRATGRGLQDQALGRSPLVAGTRMADLAPEERRALESVAAAFTPWILALVLSEAVAILGLILAILGGSPEAGLPFAGVALLLNLATRPDAVRRARESLGHIGL